MSKNKTNQSKWLKRLSMRCVTVILITVMLMQTLSLGCFALADNIAGLFGKQTNDLSFNGIGSINSDEIVAQMKAELNKYMNQDLLMKVEDYKLTGTVKVILTFKGDSLITAFSAENGNSTYEEFRNTASAQKLQTSLEENQSKVINSLVEKGLISEVKYNYYHALNGAYVTTTYEQLSEIINVEGIERITVSDTYLPAIAVENPVNVYDTGIFNSGDVSYTGRGTIVAVLDTGCDYAHSAFTTHQVQDPLYDRDDIAGFLPQTQAYSFSGHLEAREVYYGNITGNKIAFGYDYADRDPDIMPFSNEHGTHVAGIIAGKDDTITGVAVDAQLAIMKVFSDYKVGAEDGDILAALEDAVILGVDAINMSLGTSCGFSREADDDYKNSLYDNIKNAGISLIVAASNDYSSGYGSEEGNTNKTQNPDSATVGAPSTYDAALSVASINGNMDKYMFANGEREVFFHESYNMAAKEYDFFAMLGVAPGVPKEYEYVTIPGVGMPINYAGLDMTNKIALVRRGDITFEEKVQYAAEAGAVAIIIYNNIPGVIIMTVGNDVKIPVISIDKDDGEALAAVESGVINFKYENQAGPFMSDFSSWGPTPDLKLKPEITAHGGNILSAIPGGGYDKLSGTSMAAPNMCGIVVLIRQYIKEMYPSLSVTEVRDMVNQLCMSTATIALDNKGNPYSPRKQGAGIADLKKSTTTNAYLFVEGLGKTKLELGDDPARTGVYTMTIQLKNLSDKTISYKMGNITMTETVSSADPEYVAERAYLLSNSASYSVKEGTGTLVDDVVSVPAGGCATVTATIVLSAEDKAYLNSSFKNGMYVEGYLTFDNQDENGVDLNAPFLAFYGDWSEAPIFDLDYYEEETEAHNNAIDEDDKIKADYYPTTPLGSYYYDYIIPLGSYVYTMDEEEYTPIPATREKAAVSYYKDSISGIYGVFCGLLRGAKEMNITITDTATGEVVWSETQYDCYKAHFGGAQYPYVSEFDLPMVDVKTGEVFGYNNAKYEVTMSAKLDWEGNRNSSDTYSFSFTVDYEPPTVTDAKFRTEYDKSREENRYYVDVMVYDNQYAMTLFPAIVYETDEDKDNNGIMDKGFTTLSDYPIPIYQENCGEVTKVTVEITDYIDLIKASEMPEGISFYVVDYAMNGNICYVPFPETENAELEFITSTLEMDINQTFDLTTYLAASDNREIEPIYLETLTWSSSDESVVAVKDGKIEALKTGTATIKVSGATWGEDENPVYKSVVVTVSETEIENSESSANVQIEDLSFTGYTTLFAFNGDIDYSAIGKTDSIHYFGGKNSIEFYPSEKIQLSYNLKPWNLDPERYTLKWSTSNPKVVTVDEEGVVTAQAEGTARVTLQITIDGKTSLMAARCSFEVKSEFVIENRTLIAYKGHGGEVVIPDDEGILYIGAFAFCHYDLDNEKEVEVDEDGDYDFDDKKDPLGNTTVTSVVIPEGVETIQKYAFYNSSLLRSVTLPESCEIIEQYAFYQCDVLEDINLDKVRVISDYAFNKCESLTCDLIGGINLSGVNSIGKYAFAETRISSAILSNLCISGEGAFKDCSKLEIVELGERTRLAPRMFENTPVESVIIYSDTVQDYAFLNCQKLTSVELRGDLTYLGKEAFSGCIKLESVVFGGICEEIAEYAFQQCTSLESITLPDCEIIIGDCAFVESGLKNVIFSKNTYLEKLGAVVFSGVSSMEVNVADSELYQIKDGVLYSKDGTKLVMVMPGTRIGNFVVPANVKEIGSGAFSSNNYLTSVSFADGSVLESIGYGAFADCLQLKTVNLPDREVAIGGSAFFGAVTLREINLNKVTSIGDMAFAGTALTALNLPMENVTIGQGAFYGCNSLRTVTLAAGAQIGSNAFAETPIMAVTLNGDGVTVGESAFFACTQLTTFDFSKLTGSVGSYAFYYCVSLKSVDMPNVKEIGESCFAGCVSLKSFSAENLEIIGGTAFAPVIEGEGNEVPLTSVHIPNVKKIGDSAFYCTKLEEIDLSGVTEMATGAFGLCVNLKKVILSDTLTEIPSYAFYECIALKEIDLSHVVRIGDLAFAAVSMPARLELTNVEYIGMQAFVEIVDQCTLEFVNAPKLKHVASQAFVGCEKLKGINAPNMEEIEIGAFAYTALEEIEISDSMSTVGAAAFEGCESFKAFYTTVNGEKVYDYVGENIMIKDGVLYSVVNNGYVLMSYPAAKEDKVFTIADNTVRIEFAAVIGALNVEEVVFPESLRRIADFAFFGCENLKTLTFNSYYAPIIEGSMSGEEIDITSETIEQYPGFETLYKYDYYYFKEKEVLIPFFYHNFIGVVTSEAAQGMTYVIPDGCSGYDAPIYQAYFNPSETNSGVTVGKYAVAFIDAARKLPAIVDRFDKSLVDAAINAYNALEGHAEEMQFVDAALIERFQQARVQYNVSVAENKINHLFDMACNEYSYEAVKDARAFWLTLTEAEQALVSNKDRLTAKIEELSTVMGKELDFTLSFSDYFPEENQDPVDPNPPVDPEPDPKPGLETWQLIVIIAASAVVVAAAVVTVIIIIKKRNVK